jgi:DNA-binding IclR family transcriptional regulator
VRGVRPVSFPVFDMSGDIAAVLTVPFMERMERDAIPIKQVRDALCDVARAVSRRLGAPQA